MLTIYFYKLFYSLNFILKNKHLSCRLKSSNYLLLSLY